MFLPVNNRSGLWKMILLLIIAGTAVLSLYPVSAEKPFVTVVAKGDQSYYLGEAVVFTGMNTDSDSTYLFLEGPGISPSGGKLTSPFKEVISGNPDTFDRVATKPDKTWEYTLNTYNLGVKAGSYTIYALSQPTSKDQFGDLTTYGTVSVSFKKPFITAKVPASPVVKGQPFTVTGIAEGIPSEVRIWIFGDNYVFNTTVPVNPDDASYSLTIDSQISGKLPKGQCYLIAQHPMMNNQFDIVVSGDLVKNLQLNGTGSLQEAFIAAANDNPYDDSYIEIPFLVEDTGISTFQAEPVTTTPVQHQTQPSLLLFASIGAIALIGGIVVWRRK